MTEDPAQDGLNWYVYCGNNPVMFVDPSGCLRASYDEYNVWHDWDAEEFGAGSDAYFILWDITRLWENAETQESRDSLHNMAEETRRLSREGTPLLYGQDIIINTLHENARQAEEFQNSLLENIWYDGKMYFIDQVSYLIGQVNRGAWDYKYNSEWQVPYSYFNGVDMNQNNAKNWTAWIYFDGMIISADKFGNMNMSYVGTKMGLPNYVYKNFTTTDKDDEFYVQYGINMANYGR